MMLKDQKLRQNDCRMKQNAYLCRVKTLKIMAQVSMTVRMDSQLKQNFDALCSRMGMSVNAAINIFANAVVRTRSIPFMISANPTEVDNLALKEFREFRNMVAASDRPELTLDEINEEIRLAREESAARKNTAL